MSKKDVPNEKRRQFLKGATFAGAAALATPHDAAAQVQSPARNPVPLPNKAAETQPPPALEPLTVGRSGSDFMIDVLKTLNFEYMAANPASSFRGLHESLINYGGNKNPEFLTCSHEEISVAMGHGYFKIENKPLCIFAHGAVGLQHATMALYNAWCDRVPVYMVIGNIADATMRRPGVEWNHTVQDAAAIVRDYVKWDDYPASLQHFAESSVRAYKIMMTPPHGSVVIVADATMQEDPIPEHAKLSIPKLPQVALPRGRFRRGGGDRAAAGAGRASRHHRRPLRPHPDSVEASRRARRGAAMRGDRHQRTAQHAVAPSAQPERPRPRQRRPGRLHPRSRNERLLEFAQLLQGRHPPHVPPHRQARRQDHQHRLGRPLHPFELPGLPALRRRRSRHRGRRRGDHAGAHRSGEEARQRRAEGGL